MEYHEKYQYFLSLISESETYILYRLITQSEIFQAFIYWNVDDYGLQIMKTQNSESQKIRILHKILHKINKKGYFKQKNVRLLKSMFISMHPMVGPFAWITASMGRGMEAFQSVALLGSNGSPGCFDNICFVGSGVSHLPLDKTP